MAKRKTSRKTKQTHTAGSDAHPYRRSCSKQVSASPSAASSPSPQPQDLVQRRRKGTPIRSPSQGDSSKGIVFAFRIQKDSDLSMAVEILSYDQVPEHNSSPESKPEVSMTAATETEIEASIGTTTVETSVEDQEFKAESTMMSSNLKFAGEQWSSDPSSYLSNNVMDLSRNVLILHSRKPQESSVSSPTCPLYHSYRRPSAPSRSMSVSQPSTPPLTDSGSSSSSSPSSSPSSPSLFDMSSGLIDSEKDLCSLDSLSSPASPLDAMKSQPARILSVRGLGAGGRRMHVYLV
ncbi:hypothetical protein BGX27_007034 [Mortierella sp. AM989]|nr:hypothetical protein BGX27_007034 [Mortierella sp. AM989]